MEYYFLNKFLIVSTPITTILSMGLVLLLLILNYSDIRASFKSIHRGTWLSICFILLLGLVLNFNLSPGIHLDVGNETDYFDVGSNIARNFKAVSIGFGGENQFSWQPVGWPTIVGLSFFILGFSPNSAFLSSTLLTSLSVVMIFFITFLTFKKENVAILASLMFTSIPGIIIYAGTAQPNASSLFFVSFLIASSFYYYENKNVASLALFLSVLALTVQYRLEFFLLIPVYLVFFHKELFKTKIHSMSLVAFLVLILPQGVIFLGRQFFSPLVKYGDNDILFNLQEWFFPFYFKGDAHSIVLNILFLLSVILIFFKKRYKNRKVHFLFLFLLFFSLSFLFPKFIMLRMLLILYIPIVVLSALALDEVGSIFLKSEGKKMIFFATVLLFFVPYLFHVNKNSIKMNGTDSENYEIFKLQTELEMNIANDNFVPSECIVLTPKTETINFIPGLKTAYLSIDTVKYIDPQKECLVFARDWCYYSNDSPCTSIKAKEAVDYLLGNYETEILREFKSDNLFYAFYRLGLPK